MTPRLAAFELDDVEDLLLAVEQQVVKAQEESDALAHGPLRPLPLGGPGKSGGGANIFRRADGDGSKQLAGKGHEDGERAAHAERGHTRGEAFEQRRVNAIGEPLAGSRFKGNLSHRGSTFTGVSVARIHGGRQSSPTIVAWIPGQSANGGPESQWFNGRAMVKFR